MTRVSRADKEKFYADGFLVVKNAIPAEMVEAARRHFFKRMGKLRERAAAGKPAQDVAMDTYRQDGEGIYTDIFAASSVKKIAEQLMGGELPPPRGVQLAFNFPGDIADHVNEAGYYDGDTPFHGWCGHLDGLWNGATRPPPIDRHISDYMRRKWRQDPSTNTCYRTYPEFNQNIRNFTALVGIALSDQRKEGAGHLGLLKGAHHEMEKVFQSQAAAGGPLGPDGPGWTRVNEAAPNQHGLNHYPDSLRQRYRRHAAVTDDGRIWPRPTFLKLSPGDAVIVHFAVPHSASRVEAGDPRLMCYYRCTAPGRPEENGATYGDALTDIWKEWKGMRAVVRDHQR